MLNPASGYLGRSSATSTIGKCWKQICFHFRRGESIPLVMFEKSLACLSTTNYKPPCGDKEFGALRPQHQQKLEHPKTRNFAGNFFWNHAGPIENQILHRLVPSNFSRKIFENFLFFIFFGNPRVPLWPPENEYWNFQRNFFKFCDLIFRKFRTNFPGETKGSSRCRIWSSIDPAHF